MLAKAEVVVVRLNDHWGLLAIVLAGVLLVVAGTVLLTVWATRRK